MNLAANKNLDVKKKILALSAISLLVLAVGFFLILKPLINDIGQRRTDISNLKLDRYKKEEQEKNMDLLVSQLRTIEPMISKIDKLIIPADGGLEFIVSMENLAKKHGVTQTLDMKSPISDPKQPDYKTTPLDIVVSGSFQSLMDYLGAIESMDYFLSIEEFTIDTNPLPGETAKLNMHIVANSYWKSMPLR